jgi:uncharacterized protein YbaA (DUF1428 family)
MTTLILVQYSMVEDYRKVLQVVGCVLDDYGTYAVLEALGAWC